MKLNFIVMLGVIAVSVHGWSAETANSSQDSENKVEKKEGKTSRKKKATICAECGKPESVCECGHTESKKDKASTHGPGDGHKH